METGMYSSINQKKMVRNQKNMRGTAVSETLLIGVPVLMICLLIINFLHYWEKKHVDPKILVQNYVGRFNITGPLFNAGDNISSTDKEFVYDMKDVSNESDNNPSQYNISARYVISTTKVQKLWMSRGTDSWLYWPYLRGQHKSDEWEKVNSWLKQISFGLQDILNEKTRKRLMLGS